VQRQRDISRLITPTVQDKMIPAYDACNRQVGSGQFERMKVHMSQHIEKTKCDMFNSAYDILLMQLNALKVQSQYVNG
jgi:hypothetical protein